MDMDQGHPINNWTVKFVVSCCVVSNQVEVSTILVSVESTGPWLHAGTCLPFVYQVVLVILHNIVQTHLFILCVNQLEYFKRNNDISQDYSTHRQQCLKIDTFILGLLFSKLWLDKIAELFSDPRKCELLLKNSLRSFASCTFVVCLNVIFGGRKCVDLRVDLSVFSPHYD